MTGSFREALLATRDGVRVQYREYAPAAPEAGPPILCLHGLTRNVRDFEDLAPMLAARGRRVVVASQRGRGGSDHDPMPERYNPGVYATDMLALLDALSIERAVYVGTSMGGLMTMITAAIAPHRIEAAVLNDIGPELDPAGLARIQSYVGGSGVAATWVEAAAQCRAVNGVAFPDETEDVFWLRFARRLFREVAPGRIVLDYDPAIARTVAPGSSALADLWPLFDALRPIPTLVVRGEISDILMASTLAEMRRRKPDLSAVVVSRIGHAPFLTEPEAWQALCRFVG